MASEKKIGSAFVELSAKGISKVKDAFQSVKATAQGITKDFQALNNVAANSFNSMKNGIMGFVAVASPGTMMQFEGAMNRLSVQIGRIFIPIVREVTQWVRGLVDWFRGLSDSTRESIVYWTKIALAATGFVLVLGKLISVASSLGPVFSFLAAHPVFSILAVSAGVFFARLQTIRGELKEMEDDSHRVLNGGTLEKKDFDKIDDLKKMYEGEKQINQVTGLGGKNKAMEAEAERKAMGDDAFFRKYANDTAGKSGKAFNDQNALGKGWDTFWNQDDAAKLKTALNAQTIYARLDKEKAGGKTEEQLKREAEKKSKLDKFAPELAQQAPQLMAVTQAWTKAQTAQQAGPEIERLDEMIRILKEIKDKDDMPIEVRPG